MRKHHFLTFALLCLSFVIGKAQCTLGVNIPSVTNVNCLGGASGSTTANITHHLTTNFSYESAVQNFIVPAGITSVVVSVAGGSGGNEGNTGLSGGTGASFSGTCNVIPGDVLSVVVGEKGTDAAVGVYEAAGGGGGTFIYDSNQVALLGPAAAVMAGYLYAVAAGGGGSAYAGNNGSNAGIDLSGNSTTMGYGGYSGGTNGLGGGAGSYGGGGGGGFLGNGANGSYYTNISYGGNDYLNGFGETGGFYDNNGGFGGGGGGGDAGGGGGGGYNGGGGGSSSGGGGGSYLFGYPSSLVSAPVANNIGNGSASITYMFVGNTSPYTYSWGPNGGTDVTATGLTIGTYTVTVTDVNGCVAHDSAIITQLPAVTVSISQVNTSCNGVASAIATANVFNGNLPFTYSWSNGGGTSSTANNLSAGIYSVNVTDAVGCSASASVSITQPVLLDPQIFAKMSCNGGTGMATISATQTVTTTFSYTGMIQNLVIPPNALGTATVSIAGAMGGSWYSSIGGAGATFSGICTIVPEDTMSIVVGGAGGINYNYACGGGGGSFIWDANTNILLAAAAGGGGGADGFDGGWGGIDLSGNGTTVGLGYNNAAGGTGGNGGGGGNYNATYGSGGGGAGWLSNGGDAFGGNPGLGGMDKANGFAGGGSPDGAPGGFGGGGGGGWGGGGGGGYNGGGGGNDPTYYYSGGGGGSYLNGTVVGSPNADNTGNGSAVITYIAFTGRPPYTYSWSNGDTSSLVTGLSAGTYTATVTDANGCSTSESVTIIQPALLTSSVSVSANVSCNGGYDGSAGVNVSGGISPYTYSWSGSIERTSSTASELTEGTYIVSIIDSNGCTAVANVTITQPAFLRDTISSINNVLCYGGSGSLTAGIATGGTSPYTYSWSSGLESNRTLTGLSAGTYFLTVTDVHGCNAELSATITQPAVLTLTPSQTNISSYGAANGTATANAAGGTSPYTYSWSDGETSSSTNPVLVPGIYTIAVKDANQCSASASVTITQPTPLGIPSTVVANAICNGGLGTAEILFNQTSKSFLFDSAVQNFSVPSGVTVFNVAISGGAGNNNVWYGGTIGLGASFSGICNVIPGDVISVVVGQKAPQATSAFGGGGGGASWVYDSNQVASLGVNSVNPLAVAGGGGGNGSVYWGVAGNAGTSLLTSAATDGGYGNGAGGTGGNGGQAGVPGQYGGGGGGAGWLSSGVIGSGGSDGGVAYPGNNYALPRHFAGGNQFPGQTNNIASGNFGGYGGGGGGTEYAGGGGGGYNGGGGGNDYYYNSNFNGGGGGGSFLDGYVLSTAVANNSGNGQVTISYSNLGGTPPYTYSWSPNGGTNAIAEVTAGSYTVTVTDNAGYVALAYVSISQPALPLAISFASVNNVPCNGGTGSITANAATGGVPPYNYSWSPVGGTNLSISVSAGTYTLYATDNLGCTATSVTTVTQPTPLGITIASQNNVSCNGGMGSAIANPANGGTLPYTYSWSPAGGTGLTASGLSAGTYTLMVTDKSGCNTMTQATITQPASPLSASVDSVTNPVCYGGTGSAAIGLYYAVTATFSFEPAVQNLVIPPAALSTVTLTVAGAAGGSDGGCSGIVGGNGATFTGICTVIPGHVLSVAVGQAGGNSSYCLGGGGGGGTFVYDSNTIAPLAIAGGGGGGSEWDETYYGDNQNGTPGGDTVTSPYPSDGLYWGFGILITGAGGTGGSGGAMGSDNYGYGYNAAGGAGWLGNGGNDTGSYPSGGGLDRANGFLGGFPQSGDVNNGGYGGGGGGGQIAGGGGGGYNGGGGGGDIIYYGGLYGEGGGGGGGSYLNGALSSLATATNSANGYATITYSIFGAPNLNTGGTAPYTYSWSPSGGSNISATGLTAGTYTVTVTDNHGCSAVTYVTITQPATALGATISSVTNVSCNGGTGSALAVASWGTTPYTYSWSDGATTSSAGNLSAGTYSVEVTDANNCSASASVTITQAASLGITVASVTNGSCYGSMGGIVANPASGGTSPYTYSWSGGAGTSLSVTSVSAGTYTITVFDNNGCSSSDSATVTQGSQIEVNITTISNTCPGGNNGSAGVPLPFDSTFSANNTMWNFTVPDLVTTLSVTVAGGQGGKWSNFSTAYGALFTGECTVYPGEIIDIVPGGIGGSGHGLWGAGGGGGTYVYDTVTLNLLAVAGGGGGASIGDGYGSPGGTDLINNTCIALINPTLDGVGGNGGSTGNNTLMGGGGAGWNSNGEDAVTGIVNGGNDRANGFIASFAYYGYGGRGGGGCGGLNGGGGGGGYNGGAAGGYHGSDYFLGGDGGSSYLNGTLVGAITSVNTGGGYAILRYNYGGTSPYTYSWSDAGHQTTAIATGLSAGTYTLTITDANGCSASATATITQSAAAISVIASANNISCNGAINGSSVANVSGGSSPFTYLWSTGVTSSSITGLSAGTYSVQVNDANGCGAIDSVTITEPIILSASGIVTSNINCNGSNNGSGIVNASGGTLPYTYSWSDGATASSVGSLSAGSYSITITDANNCSTSASISISQPANPLSLSALTTANITCNGRANGSGYTNVSGGTAPYTYSWSPSGGSNISATGLTAGIYTITVTDNHACSAFTLVTITQPTAVSATTTVTANISCNGDKTGSGRVNASGGTSPYTYNWSTGAATASINLLGVGSYSVTVTDNNGCSTTASLTITQPTALTVSAIAISNVLCNGSSTGSGRASASNGTSPYTYSWSNGAITTSLSGITAGTYSVTVHDNNGCSAVASITITQPPSSLGITIASVTNINCNGSGGSATANTATGGTSPYTYSWSGGAGTGLSASVSAGTYTITVTDNHGCSAIASATITQLASVIRITIASISNVSCNGGRGSITANAATGGTSPYTYSWSGGAGTNLSASVSAGTYTLTAMDNHGCSAITSATITQPASALGISIASASNISCNGGRGNVTANAATGGTSPYTYSWSGGAGTSLSASVSAGTYTITVTDKHGCSASASAIVTQPTALGISIHSISNVSCNGGRGSVTANAATGGTSPYTYSWSGGAGTNLAASVSAGTYTITVTDRHGCTATTSAIVTQPVSALTISTSISANISCNGGSNGIVNANTSGGTSVYTYSWSNGTTKSSASGLSAGTYSVTITDAHGCSATARVIITQPTAISLTTRSVNLSACETNTGSVTSTVIGGTSPYTYRWSNSRTTAVIIGLSAGTYSVTVTDSHGCTTTASAIITRAPAITATKTITNVSCHGNNNGTASVSVSGGTSPYTYRWSNTRTTASITGLSAGTYTLTITDAAGCTLTESAIITQPAAALAITTVDLDNVSCNGGGNGSAEGIASGGTSPYTYRWSNSKTTSTITGLSAGIYTITLSDTHGCTATANVKITQPAVLRDSLVTSTCIKSLITATVGVKGGTSPYTYSWSICGGTKATMTGLSPGTYVIRITDRNGCTSTVGARLSCNVNTDSPVDSIGSGSKCCPDGIDNINLYPNPNNGQFTIAGVEKGMIVEVYDYTGRRINILNASGENMQINIYDQANGLYLIRILDKEGNLVSQKKVVKTK